MPKFLPCLINSIITYHNKNIKAASWIVQANFLTFYSDYGMLTVYIQMNAVYIHTNVIYGGIYEKIFDIFPFRTLHGVSGGRAGCMRRRKG